jgi:hypothetical protein
LVHEGQIRIETPAEGGWRFVHPDGRHYEVIRRTASAEYTGEEIGHTHADLGIRIDHNTAATRWRGERMDYELGVWILCQQVERARRIHDRNASGDSRVSDGYKANIPNGPKVSDVSAETSGTGADTGHHTSGSAHGDRDFVAIATS